VIVKRVKEERATTMKLTEYVSYSYSQLGRLTLFCTPVTGHTTSNKIRDAALPLA